MIHTYLVSRFDFEVEILEYRRLVFTVFHVQVIEFYGSLAWPRGRRLLVCEK